MKKKVILNILLLLIANLCIQAQTKTIKVIPSNAKIFIDGSEVGVGTYPYKFKKDDYILVRCEAKGYIGSKEIKVFKNDPRKTIEIRMREDEAMKNSVGADEGVENANKWVDIPVRRGLAEGDAWKRVNATVRRYFDNIEVSDKSGGYIKTSPVPINFGDLDVRTFLEIKESFGGDDLQYQARITTEIKWADENSQGYQKYPRILKKYGNLLQDLQNTLGGNR